MQIALAQVGMYASVYECKHCTMGAWEQEGSVRGVYCLVSPRSALFHAGLSTRAGLAVGTSSRGSSTACAQLPLHASPANIYLHEYRRYLLVMFWCNRTQRRHFVFLLNSSKTFHTLLGFDFLGAASPLRTVRGRAARIKF